MVVRTRDSVSCDVGRPDWFLRRSWTIQLRVMEVVASPNEVVIRVVKLFLYNILTSEYNGVRSSRFFPSWRFSLNIPHFVSSCEITSNEIVGGRKKLNMEISTGSKILIQSLDGRKGVFCMASHVGLIF